MNKDDADDDIEADDDGDGDDDQRKFRSLASDNMDSWKSRAE